MAEVIVVMGVSGVGKTTLGQALAASLGAVFVEGDSYHPKENVDKMRGGRPLSDEDRWPWLDRLHTAIDDWLARDQRVVLACSALKASYRERLALGHDNVRFVLLQANRSLIGKRLAERKGHYMPPSLLDSQLDTLEPPEDAITVDAGQTLDDIIAELLPQLDEEVGVNPKDDNGF